MPSDRPFFTAIASDRRTRREVLRKGTGLALSLTLSSTACAQADVTLDRFSDIAERKMPIAVQALRTRGWSEPGIGAARYVFDPRVDRQWVRRHPRSSAISADGRGFRLETIGGDVRCYGAVGDGTADDAAAINEALSQGGTAVLAGPATYFVRDRLLLPVARTRLLFDAGVTLRTRAWRYRGQQTPFGNAIHITGDDCEVIGGGATSIIDSLDSDANGIGFLHCGGGRVAKLVLNGGKASIAAIIDDTFQSGISIINDRANNPGKRASRIVIEDCTINDWVQYGINVYGDLATDIVIRRTTIRRSGKAADPESVGAGIALTRGVGPVSIDHCTITDNKGFGIFVSSAGAAIRDVTLSHNRIVNNGSDGIRCTEERHFSAVDAIGQQGVMITDNRIERNHGMGIRAGTYDGVGSIARLAILRNRIADNRGSGVLLQANADAARGVDAIIDRNDFIGNGDYGIAIGLNHVSLRHDGNNFEGNRNGATIDHSNGAPKALVERSSPRAP